MAFCFPKIAPNLSSSDRTGRAGAKTIFGNIRNNIRKNIPQKVANKPGSVNYVLCPRKSGGDPTGSVTGAMSFETRMEMLKGQFLCDKTCFSPCQETLYGLYGGNSLFKQNSQMKLLEDHGVQRAPAYIGGTLVNPPNWRTRGITNSLLSVSSDFWSGSDTSSSCASVADHGNEFVVYPDTGYIYRTPCGVPRKPVGDPAISIANPAELETVSKTALSNRMFGFGVGPLRNIKIDPQYI